LRYNRKCTVFYK